MSRVDFPLPALPVTKRFFFSPIRSITRCISSVISKSVGSERVSGTLPHSAFCLSQVPIRIVGRIFFPSLQFFVYLRRYIQSGYESIEDWISVTWHDANSIFVTYFWIRSMYPPMQSKHVALKPNDLTSLEY